jgi:hypothetical protein
LFTTPDSGLGHEKQTQTSDIVCRAIAQTDVQRGAQPGQSQTESKTIDTYDVNPSQSMLRNRSRAGFLDVFDSIGAKPLSKTNSDGERRTDPNQDIEAAINTMK